MDNEIIELLPKTIVGWSTLFGFVVLGIFTLFFQIRNQSVKLLRTQVEDMKKRIEFLEEKTKDYDEMKFKKNYLKSIVIQAISSKAAIDQTLAKEVKEHLEVK
jgi:hypothetical protein